MRINSSSKSVIGLVVYRTGAAFSFFYSEFENTLGVLATYNGEVSILRNFNFCLKQPDNTDAQSIFKNLRSMVLIHSQTNPPITKKDGLM